MAGGRGASPFHFAWGELRAQWHYLRHLPQT